MTLPRFFPGQLVHHNRFDYRGVIAHVDAEYAGTDEWYEAVAKSRPPKDAPWYLVLVDGAVHTTYVAERHLEPDAVGDQVSHPELGVYFDRFGDGRYWLKNLV